MMMMMMLSGHFRLVSAVALFPYATLSKSRRMTLGMFLLAFVHSLPLPWYKTIIEVQR